MTQGRRVDFERALQVAREVVTEHWAALGGEVLLVRDLFGRLRVILPKKPEDSTSRNNHRHFANELSGALGPFGYEDKRTILYANDLLEGDALLRSEDRRRIPGDEGRSLWLLDRQLIGLDWERPPLKRRTQNKRVTFFGIKGGVGRSTALIILAWRLAQEGKSVLIFDLDLESPGTSTTLLPVDELPEYGIVDWFVEDAVGQADALHRSMVATSPLGEDLGGEIRVVPAFGSATGDYLPKLARCYLDLNTGGAPLQWGERLQRMVEGIEEKERPDVVFLDSRAGLHDIAAVAVTRMDAETLLFAVESAQTWAAYGLLFRHWKTHPQVSDFRTRLQMVASMVPETGGEAYLARFREHAWDLFRDNIYDEADAKDADAFNFNLDDAAGPHSPLPILWSRPLQEFDPVRDMERFGEGLASVAMAPFIDGAKRWVFPEEGV